MALGQFEMESMSPEQMQGIVNTFIPMIEQFYNQMDHEQSMADFKKDDNGVFDGNSLYSKQFTTVYLSLFQLL